MLLDIHRILAMSVSYNLKIWRVAPFIVSTYAYFLDIFMWRIQFLMYNKLFRLITCHVIFFFFIKYCDFMPSILNWICFRIYFGILSLSLSHISYFLETFFINVGFLFCPAIEVCKTGELIFFFCYVDHCFQTRTRPAGWIGNWSMNGPVWTG